MQLSVKDLAPEWTALLKPVGKSGYGIESDFVLFSQTIQLQGKIYALKLYALVRPHWRPSRFEVNALEMDSFIVESQVYDILTENQLNGLVGPRCYGWLTINKHQEQKLEQKLGRSLDWRRRQDTSDDPIRGLLLEYIDGCTLDKAHVTPLAAQSLRDQLNQLHSLDIVHGDVLRRNIMVSKDGRASIIDFSSAIIWPSQIRVRNRESFLEYIKEEKSGLDLSLFRLQQLKRHLGTKLSEALTEEEVYGRPINTWANQCFTFVD